MSAWFVLFAGIVLGVIGTLAGIAAGLLVTGFPAGECRHSVRAIRFNVSVLYQLPAGSRCEDSAADWRSSAVAARQSVSGVACHGIDAQSSVATNEPAQILTANGWQRPFPRGKAITVLQDMNRSSRQNVAIVGRSGSGKSITALWQVWMRRMRRSSWLQGKP